MAERFHPPFSGCSGARTVAVLGLTFKPNTDDMREAPSIPLITALQDMGAKVRAYDPVGMEQAKQVLAEVTYCLGAYECVEGADAVVIVTEWEQFRALDLERVKRADGLSGDGRSQKHIPAERRDETWVRLHQRRTRLHLPIAEYHTLGIARTC